MGPLKDLRILDFSALLPGPYATMMLADFGADVIRVSSETRPDVSFALPPYLGDSKLNAFAAHIGRNKRSITLDLKNKESLTVIHRLIQKYDVVIEQFRPGVMAKLGLDYESLKKINPRIIYCSLTGYGQTGPLKDRAGHDINYLALSGVMSASGRKKTGPTLTSLQLADVAAGSNNAVIGILAAAFSRERTGKGEYIDISMLDGITCMNALASHPYLGGGKEIGPEEIWFTGGSVYDFYQTKDGRYLSVGSLEPKFYANFCQAISRPDLADAKVESDENKHVKVEIAEILKTKTLDEWTKIFDATDACVEPVLTMAEALSSEAAKARETVVELEIYDGQKVRQLANPVKFSANAVEYRCPGCLPGTHTREVLLENGFSETEFDQLQKKGVFK